jgi:putative transcriptional regulator
MNDSGDGQMQPRLQLIGYFLALTVIAAIPGERVGGTDAAPTPYHGGKFLVATDELRDPRFLRTVVYLVHHDAESAMGLVVNRPLKDVPAADLLEDTGLDPTGVTGRVRLHYGGPVQPGRGFILHSPDYQGTATQAIGSGVALTADARIVEAIGRGKGPRQYLLALGYAGWAAGQLEAEIAAGAWEVVPADAALLFDDAAETKWERAMARRMITM